MFSFKTTLNCRNTVDTFSTTHELNCPTDGFSFKKINLVGVKHKHHLSYFTDHNNNDTPVTVSCWREYNMTFTITI